MIPGVFSHDDDGDDIVTLRPADGSGIECHGWVNIGQHAVQLTLDAHGGLCIRTHAKGQEAQVLGSLYVPRLAATLARLSTERGDPLVRFTNALTELGFDKDESVSGADTVDVVAQHYPSLLALVDAHDNQQGEIS